MKKSSIGSGVFEHCFQWILSSDKSKIMSDEHEVPISGLFVNIWIKLKHDFIKAILQLAHGLFSIGQLKKKC